LVRAARMISLDRCRLRWRVNYGGRALLWHRFGMCTLYSALASSLEPMLLFALNAGLRRPRWRNALIVAQRIGATSRNADAMLLCSAGHPRMCAVHVPTPWSASGACRRGDGLPCTRCWGRGRARNSTWRGQSVTRRRLPVPTVEAQSIRGPVRLSGLPLGVPGPPRSRTSVRLS
jgi:hypothetical protein